jgi:hypothetical protein
VRAAVKQQQEGEVDRPVHHNIRTSTADGKPGVTVGCITCSRTNLAPAAAETAALTAPETAAAVATTTMSAALEEANARTPMQRWLSCKYKTIALSGAVVRHRVFVHANHVVSNGGGARDR